MPNMIIKINYHRLILMNTYIDKAGFEYKVATPELTT